MTSDIAIKLTNVSKRYYLHSQKPTLVENLNPFKKPSEFWALKDVNLTVKKGDRIGIIGPNGAGKTTLLKLIAGITKPTTGIIKTQGKVVSLIELTAGFNPEMNGVDNIYLNGIILNSSKNEVSKRLNDIISFADIGSFIHQPLYTYSEGMKLRLGFAVAIHCAPRILILDENIATGDERFQNKCISKINELWKRNYLTLVVCSHTLDLIRTQTDRSYVINNGTLIYESSSADCITKYQHMPSLNLGVPLS